MAKRKTPKNHKAPTKSEILSRISEDTELTKKEVVSVFDSLAGQIKKNLGSRGPGVFTMPGLCKMTVKKKPAKSSDDKDKKLASNPPRDPTELAS